MKYHAIFNMIANIIAKMQRLKRPVFSGYGLGPNSDSGNMKGNGEQEQNLYYKCFLAWFSFFFFKLKILLKLKYWMPLWHKNQFASRQEVTLKRREKINKYTIIYIKFDVNKTSLILLSLSLDMLECVHFIWDLDGWMDF